MLFLELVEVLQKEENKIYEENQKLEKSRNLLFSDLGEDADILDTKLKKIETSIEENNEKVKVLGEEVINPEEENKIVLTEKGQNIDIDLAYSQPVTVSSSKDGENVTDRDANTTWTPDADDENPSLTIGLDREYNIENFSVDFEGEAAPYKVLVNTSEGWVEAGSCDSKDSGKVVSASKDEITGIKFTWHHQTDTAHRSKREKGRPQMECRWLANNEKIIR